MRHRFALTVLQLSMSVVGCAGPSHSTLDSDTVVLVDEEAEAGHRRTRLAAELCAEIECDGATAAKVQAAIAKLPQDAAPDEVGRRMTNGALADAFRQSEFDATVLDEYWAITRPQEEALHEGRLTVLRALHEALPPPLRLVLSQRIRRRGLAFLHTRSREASAGDARRDRQWVEQICQLAACSTSQQQGVRLAFADVDGPAFRGAIQRERQRLAESFASNSLDEQIVESFRQTTMQSRSDRRQATDDALVVVHRILSSTQRAAVADELDVEGMAGLR